MRLQYPNGSSLPLFLELDGVLASDTEAAAHTVILLNVQLPRFKPPPSIPSSHSITFYNLVLSPSTSAILLLQTNAAISSFWKSLWQVCGVHPRHPASCFCWQRCSYKVCADGGANALFDAFNWQVASQSLPLLIFVRLCDQPPHSASTSAAPRSV
jgi:hypothetical protein